MIKKLIFIVLTCIFLTTFMYAETTRAIETFPYTENFENVTIPALPEGWTAEDTNNDNITWGTRSINGFSAPYSAACDYNDMIAMDDWLFTPSLHLQSNVSYRIIFSYKCEYGDYPEKLEVKWGSGPSSVQMTSSVVYSNTNIVNESFTEVTTIFLVTTRNDDNRSYYNIGFHGFSDAFQWTLWLDNITIEEIPSTPVFYSDTPSYNFGSQQISYNSTPKNVTVSNAGGGTLYLESCTIIGPNASDFVLVDSNVYTVTLTDQATMSVGVRFHPQSTGSKTATLRFRESATIVHDIPLTGNGINNTVTTFPFNQNFEGGALPANWIKIADGAGWRFGSNLGRGTFPIPAHTNYAAVNKNTSIFEFDPLPGRNDFLIPPPFNMTSGVGIPHLTFNSYYTMYAGEHATVEYSTDGTNWNLLYEMPAYTGGWKFTDVNLGAFVTSTRFFIRFHADDMGIESATGWAIDDVNLLFVDPTPTPPTNLRISRLGTNIHLTWNPVLYVNGYRVYSAPDYNSDLWTLETPVPITETSWTGNTSLTRKFFKIVSVR